MLTQNNEALFPEAKLFNNLDELPVTGILQSHIQYVMFITVI